MGAGQFKYIHALLNCSDDEFYPRTLFYKITIVGGYGEPIQLVTTNGNNILVFYKKSKHGEDLILRCTPWSLSALYPSGTSEFSLDDIEQWCKDFHYDGHMARLTDRGTITLEFLQSILLRRYSVVISMEESEKLIKVITGL